MLIRPLPPKLREKAEKELNEDSNRLNEDLEHIEEWLKKQPHLNIRKDPQFLLSFLRSSKFSLQRTKEKLDFFYTMKTLTPEFFINKNPDHREIKELLDKAGIFPITKSTAQAGTPAILFLRWGTFNPDSVHFSSLVKLALMGMDVLLNEDDNATVNGLYILHDMQGFNLGYIKHLTPALCKKVILSVQNAYPLRIKGILFINTPLIYEVFINMFTPFLNEKLRVRFKIFREEQTEKFHKHVPQKVMPEEYGGTAGTTFKINDEYRAVLETYKNWFINDEQYGSDESKRPGEPKTSADIFGVEGTFRKLNID